MSDLIHRQSPSLLQSVTYFMLFICLCTSGCAAWIGPPRPEYYAGKYLREHGFATNVITALLNGKEIDTETIDILLKVPDISVRHMLGRNQCLSREKRGILFQDKSEFVKSGVALNLNLTREEVCDAVMMPSRLGHIRDSLAMNASVPQDILITLRREYKVSLLAFAQNPNCPLSIAREIEKSGSLLEQKLLDITRRVHGGLGGSKN